MSNVIDLLLGTLATAVAGLLVWLIVNLQSIDWDNVDPRRAASWTSGGGRSSGPSNATLGDITCEGHGTVSPPIHSPGPTH